MEDEEVIPAVAPLRVGDVVRVTTAAPVYLQTVSTGSALSYNHTYNSLPVTFTPGNAVVSYPNWYHSSSNKHAPYATKAPAIGAVLVVTGVLKNEMYPLDVQDLETGEGYEIYRYQVKRDDFMTAVRRRKEARYAAIDQASDCAPRTVEPLLMEDAHEHAG